MSKRLSVGLTYDLASEHTLLSTDPKDKYSEFDTKRIVYGIAKALKSAGHRVTLIGSFKKLLATLDEVQQSVDIVFNTAEGLSGRNREAQVPLLLEYAHIPYIGADALSMSVTLDKVITKKLLVSDSISTPRFLIADAPLTESEVSFLQYPLVVKPRWEGSSKGITPKSKVSNLIELNAQITRLISEYHQPTVIEEFIAGKEFTVGLVGNGKETVVLPPLEITIRGSSVGSKLFLGRYVYSSDVHYVPLTNKKKEFTEMLKSLALRTYITTECRDFSRVDIRVDESGTPYVLEINPLPALSRQDAFGVWSTMATSSYEDMILRIFTEGCRRYNLA